MKKLIAIALIAVMVLGMAACGTINKAEVSVLWSGDGVVKVPNSLINAMERAMYSVNVSYKHYGAKGDQAEQTKQAEAALNAGCAALVVELVDASAAQTIVDAAKAKNVPVIFINCAVEEAVVKTYNKCVLVDTNDTTMASVLGKLIGKNLADEKTFKKLDRNGDGKITYAVAEVQGAAARSSEADAIVAAVNEALKEAKLAELVAHTTSASDAIATFTEESASVELILAMDDQTALGILVALQAKGYNKDRLTTHFVPVYTVGDTADYKALVLADRPAGAQEDDAVQEYYKSMQYILDLRNVEDEDLDALICTTSTIIGNGRLSGTAIEDYDGIAVAAATVLRNLLKGTDTFKDISAETVSGSWAVKVPYTTVG